MNKQITITSYGKINLSIDVLGKREDGMHFVDMIMQQVAFHDDVKVVVNDDIKPSDKKHQIKIIIDKFYIPTDNRNLAYQAAELILEKYSDKIKSKINILIDIKKRIPVAGGMAGGSANAASVIIALNTLLELDLGLKEMEDLGRLLGSDIPFSIRGQLKGNYIKKLPKGYGKVSSCCRATGTGSDLQKLKPLSSAVILVKPKLSVSTKEVYKGIDSCEIKERPNNDKLCKALERGDKETVFENMINVLENYTLNKEREVKKIKELMIELLPDCKVLMSGSGPTVFALCPNNKVALKGRNKLRQLGYEAYNTYTTR